MNTPGLILSFLFMDIEGVGYSQSFTQTIGGASAQDGIGAVVAGDGYRVSVRDHDPATLRHVAKVFTMTASGGSASSVVLPIEEEVFLQAQANAQDGSAFLIGSVIPVDGPDHDGLVVKLGTDGGILWTLRPSRDGSQQYWGGVALPDGSAVVCGVTTENGGHDVIITRINGAGTILWTHVEPGPTDSEARAVAIEASTILITGRQKTFSGRTDVLFLRMDLEGNLIWTTTWGGAADEEGRAIVPNGDGTFTCAGWTTSYGRFDNTSQRIPAHVYLFNIDLDGDTLWTRAIGDTLYDRRAYAVERSPNGDLLLAGERSTSALSDASLFRTTPIGTVLWERSVDTGKEERILHLLPLPDGGVVGTGWSFSEFGRQMLFLRRSADGF